MKKFLLSNLAILFLTTVANAQEVTNKEVTMKDEKNYSTSNYTPTPVSKLSEMQKYITQHGGTEPAFQNEYWNNKEQGIYVDVVSGEPLFSSTDKYDSGTGWPSFTKPIDTSIIDNKTDNKFGMQRTEVLSKNSNSHLGHVFDDGPKDKGGKRFCINSGALRFVPKDKLQAEGYGEYLKLFEANAAAPSAKK